MADFGVPTEERPTKVDQLVGKGFHNIVVSLGQVTEISSEGIEQVGRGRELADRWAGVLSICDASREVSAGRRRARAVAPARAGAPPSAPGTP